MEGGGLINFAVTKITSKRVQGINDLKLETVVSSLNHFLYTI